MKSQIKKSSDYFIQHNFYLFSEYGFQSDLIFFF